MTYLSKKKSSLPRRDFIKTSAWTSAGLTILPRHVLGGKGYLSPSDKVTIGIVGAGGRGMENVEELLQWEDVEVVAIADPAEYWDLSKYYYRDPAGRGPVKQLIETHYEKKEMTSKVNTYIDFRAMLERETSLDAILCATPDHTHAYISLTAMDSGKHVYCEKPLTHNLWEARRVKEMAKITGLATQMGNQLHSSDILRQTVEYLRAGIIGDVTEVHAWVPATRWRPELKGVPEGNSALPPGLDWNIWLGPRSNRDFNEAFAPVTWRDFWDFGCGAMGDFGCHDLDAAVWGLDLPLPESVELFPAGFSNKDIAPYGEIGYYKFFVGETKRELNLTWYSGGLKPQHPDLIPSHYPLPSRGALYVGNKGVMLYGGGSRSPLIFPEDLRSMLDGFEKTLPTTRGHHRDWLDAIKGGPAPSSNFEYAAHLTEITLLGVLSLRLGGKKIYWDAANMAATGIPEAEQFIREPVRTGWEMT